MQPLIDLGFEPTHFDKTKPPARPERGRPARSAAERAGGTPALQARRFGETAEQSHRVEVRRGSANGHFYKTNLQKG